MKSKLHALLIATVALFTFTSENSSALEYLDTEGSNFNYDGVVFMKLASTTPGETVTCWYAQWTIDFKNATGTVKAKHFLFRDGSRYALQANPWRNAMGNFLAWDLNYNDIAPGSGTSTNPYKWWIQPEQTTDTHWANFVSAEFESTTQVEDSDPSTRYVLVWNAYDELINIGQPYTWTEGDPDEVTAIWSIPSCYDDSTNFVHWYEWFGVSQYQSVQYMVLDSNDDIDFYAYSIELVKDKD